ncbi:twitching motility protein PilT [Devosia geojensis]|uniref:Ribonuclease VapC n=1 Tax=Devosia geojensis TaxID=443610 RepID=A0A0F5FYU2_9HYPH|nr:type II toxin-antitoxin system VapC family toxin [Devosia geojensis]KKB13735.1 twitching motility protein PilT [Devosia geojensis]
MVKALFDTNVLVDYLNAVPEARDELERYSGKAISIVTWMEVLVGATPAVEAGTRAFLAGFEVVPLDDAIAEHAVALRRAHRVKLPDAVIWATAETRSLLLVTRDGKDFPADLPGIRVPYSL